MAARRIAGTDFPLVFDFLRWQKWLEARSEELARDGFDVRFHAGPVSSQKPGASLGMIGQYAMGNFEIWSTGENDYTVMKPLAPSAKMVAHKWGLKVTDETFEESFSEFLEAFRQANSN
jgi:hypothetical protein